MSTKIIIFEEFDGDKYYLFNSDEELNEICHEVYLDRKHYYSVTDKEWLKTTKEKYPYITLIKKRHREQHEGFTIVTPENNDYGCFAPIEEKEVNV